MSKRPRAGRGLFYHRDSEGHSEPAPPQYVAWAQGRAKEPRASFSGTPARELAEHERVKMPGHHVRYLPTAENEPAVVRRILDAIETTPGTRIADAVNADGIPSPKAGRIRTLNGVPVPNSGVWTQTTVRNMAANRLLAAVGESGKRAEGGQQRMTAAGPRDLSDGDYDAGG